jgi:hypothetical protein
MEAPEEAVWMVWKVSLLESYELAGGSGWGRRERQGAESHPGSWRSLHRCGGACKGSWLHSRTPTDLPRDVELSLSSLGLFPSLSDGRHPMTARAHFRP